MGGTAVLCLTTTLPLHFVGKGCDRHVAMHFSDSHSEP